MTSNTLESSVKSTSPLASESASVTRTTVFRVELMGVASEIESRYWLELNRGLLSLMSVMETVKFSDELMVGFPISCTVIVNMY